MRLSPACECVSMKPGAITRPAASMVRAADHPDRSPTARMRPWPTATSARRAGCSDPSCTWPSRMSTSAWRAACVGLRRVARRAHAPPAASVDTARPEKEMPAIHVGIVRCASPARRFGRHRQTAAGLHASPCMRRFPEGRQPSSGEEAAHVRTEIVETGAHGPELPGGCVCRRPGGGRAAQRRLARRSARPGSRMASGRR